MCGVSQPRDTLGKAGNLLFGNEAVALGALHGGISAAYSYPGTPATEILEFVSRHGAREDLISVWACNEKSAYEAALGVSFSGLRVLVAMKHVGLNVAADPFINSALVAIHGGIVLAVADDPGMHSSQNEQDSRFYADYAHTVCLEPADQQEAYEMAIDAFDISERFQVPVMIRLVTNLAHGRGTVITREPQKARSARKPSNGDSWVLLPSNARRRWARLVELQRELERFSEQSHYNRFTPQSAPCPLAVVTAGITRDYLLEAIEETPLQVAHLHIGTYPAPRRFIEDLAGNSSRLLVLEEGFPHLERLVRGVLTGSAVVEGKLTTRIPRTGELTPDLVRAALGLESTAIHPRPGFDVPPRPPQFCDGCPHTDTFHALQLALEDFADPVVTSDIGCYTLGAAAPFCVTETCICMGASIGMAKGAADSGMFPVVATIGDSTFLHSGIPPLLDAAVADSNITVIILDNEAVAMTGGQRTLLDSKALPVLVQGLGLDPLHVVCFRPHPTKVAAFAELIRAEIEYPGLSVIIASRECVQTARRHKT